MSIDEGSSGVPEINVHRRTTKVNLWMIASIVIFFAVAAAATFWVSRRQPSSDTTPVGVTEKQPN